MRKDAVVNFSAPTLTLPRFAGEGIDSLPRVRGRAGVGPQPGSLSRLLPARQPPGRLAQQLPQPPMRRLLMRAVVPELIKAHRRKVERGRHDRKGEQAGEVLRE